MTTRSVSMLPLVLAAVLLAAGSTPVSAQDAPAGKAWDIPKCEIVSGTGAVTFTRDEGATLTPTSGTLIGTAYTLGLAVLDTPKTLLAVQNRKLLRSGRRGMPLVRGGHDRVAGGQVPALPGRGARRARVRLGGRPVIGMEPAL